MGEEKKGGEEARGGRGGVRGVGRKREEGGGGEGEGEERRKEEGGDGGRAKKSFSSALSAISFLIKSDDSHTGPTIFQFFGEPAPFLIFHTSCFAPYNDGLSKSFIAASTIRKSSFAY